MAILTSSVLGPISGRVGTIVGGSWKGIPYIRSLAASVTNPQTQAQQEQRMRFSLILVVLRSLISIIRVTFRMGAVKMTAFNAAMSANVKTAIKGVYPLLEVDYQKLILSVGNLPSVLNAMADSTLASKIEFTFDNNSTDEGAAATDLLVVFALDPLTQRAIADVTTATRADGSYTLTVPDFWSGKSISCFAAFQNPVTGDCSNSVYISAVVVA